MSQSDEITKLNELLELYKGNYEALERDLAKLKLKTKKTKQKNRAGEEVVVSLSGVSKTYKSSKHKIVAVDGVDLKIYKGDFVALTGPSGSGKSTVLNLISGLDSPEDGAVVVDGVEITKLKPNKRAEFRAKHVGFVFQFFYLQPFLDLQTNVEVPGMFIKDPKSKRRAQSKKLIEAVGLGDRLTHLPKELSGGQMQRAAIARALQNNPKIILADEPTGNLDSKNAADVMDLFELVRSKFGTTIIVVTHDSKMAARADYSIELVDGRVVN